RSAYGARAEVAHKALRNIPGISLVKPSGAFYLTITFNDFTLKPTQTLKVANDGARTITEKRVASFEPHKQDKRFAYYLMAAYGLCVVPLSGFNTTLQGFRMTLLEENQEVFTRTLAILAEAIPAYLQS
ncbi:MAG: pyridoxal phosphate-dependent aminotransferase, partial [Acidobacteria bacterium]|nr:pyridoxal phosphate-dependent aminotransferase [Acidobacteriota bacterium]